MLLLIGNVHTFGVTNGALCYGNARKEQLSNNCEQQFKFHVTNSRGNARCFHMNIVVLYCVKPCILVDTTNVSKQWYISSKLRGITAHKTAIC